MLRASGLTLRIAGRDLVTALDFTLGREQCWAVLGPNGAGKTSLLLALAGLRPPQHGEVTLDDRPLAAHARRELARRLGVLLQDDSADLAGDSIGNYGGSVLDYVLLGRFPHTRSSLARDKGAMELARGALDKLDLSAHLDQRYHTLSGGERQRARIAQLMVQDPDILLLDEPLSHLDLRHQVRVMDALSGCARRGKAVLMALHEPNIAARYCDSALLLYDAGRASLGRSSDMLTQANLEALYHCRLQSGRLQTGVETGLETGSGTSGPQLFIPS